MASVAPGLSIFLRRILLFGAVALLALVGAELGVRSMRTPYDLKAESVKEYGDSTETLLLGHSHFYYGVLADSISGMLNLALPIQNPEYDERILLHNLPYMPRLKQIALSIGWFSLFDPPLEKSGAPWAETSYQIHCNLGKYSSLSVHNLELYDPAVRLRKLRQLTGIDPVNLPTPRGFGMEYASAATSADLRLQGPEVAVRHNTVAEGYEAYNLAWLDSLARTCAVRGLQLIFVAAPVSASYREAIEKTPAPGLTRELLRGFQEQYGIPFIDFSADSRFGDGDFHDADHLDAAGARKFTPILADTLASIRKQ